MPDFNVFPSDAVDLPDSISASSDGDTGDNLSFDFCILFQGTSVKTLQIYAPSQEAADATADSLVQKLNEALEGMGYPPNCVTWSEGACGS